MKLSKTLYGLATACKEWYLTLGDTHVEYLGVSTSLDKGDYFWGEEDVAYNFGTGLRDKCIGNNERWIFEIVENCGPSGKAKCVRRCDSTC